MIYYLLYTISLSLNFVLCPIFLKNTDDVDKPIMSGLIYFLSPITAPAIILSFIFKFFSQKIQDRLNVSRLEKLKIEKEIKLLERELQIKE